MVTDDRVVDRNLDRPSVAGIGIRHEIGILFEVLVAEISVEAQEPCIPFRLIQLDIEPVIFDVNTCLVQVRTNGYLRYDILIAVEAEHLHTVAGQSVTVVVRSGEGIAEYGIWFCQIPAQNAYQGCVGGAIAVPGDEQRGVLLSQTLGGDIDPYWAAALVFLLPLTFLPFFLLLPALSTWAITQADWTVPLR